MGNDDDELAALFGTAPANNARPRQQQRQQQAGEVPDPLQTVNETYMNKYSVGSLSWPLLTSLMQHVHHTVLDVCSPGIA